VAERPPESARGEPFCGFNKSLRCSLSVWVARGKRHWNSERSTRLGRVGLIRDKQRRFPRPLTLKTAGAFGAAAVAERCKPAVEGGAPEPPRRLRRPKNPGRARQLSCRS
jgi:hypothetical protein